MTPLPPEFSLLYDFDFLEDIMDHLLGVHREPCMATDAQLIMQLEFFGIDVPPQCYLSPPHLRMLV